VKEVLYWMNLKDYGVYCDCTVGGGGHLIAMLKEKKSARFIGIDFDPEAIAWTKGVMESYSQQVQLFEENFVHIDLILNKAGISEVDGILFDLGASYHQLTAPERGFSFNNEGPLLMQMSPQVLPLYKKLQYATKETISQVLREYGDVDNPRRIAGLIYEHRKNLKTTLDLRNLVQRGVPRQFLTKNLHKVFQAFRIWVNGEMENLKIGIEKAIHFLKKGGRIIVISYHSGEDRIVKEIFINYERANFLKRLNKKVIRPSNCEIEENPSAKSARMRVAERCE